MKATTIALLAAALLAAPATHAQVPSAPAPVAKTYYYWLHPKLGMVKVDKATNALLVGRRARTPT